jgi:hypothetical protein
LAGPQGKAVGPGSRGGSSVVVEADRLVGTCSGREGLGSRRAATWASCRIWLVRTWCLQESPRNRADDRNTSSTLVCSKTERWMRGFPSVRLRGVSSVSEKAHHCRSASASSCLQPRFSIRILPFRFPFSLSSRHSGCLDSLQDNARRQWDKGHCSRHPVWSPDVKYVKCPDGRILHRPER